MTRPTEWFSAFIGAVLALLIAFGVNLTDDQIAAIVGFFGLVPAGITFLVMWWRSRKSSPPPPPPPA